VNESVTARAANNKFILVKNHTIYKKETFKDILQGGNKEEVLEFLRTKNL
jgi:hypothetical protein